MMYTQYTKAQTQLTPIFEELQQCVQLGFNDHLSLIAFRSDIKFNRTTKTNIIHDCIKKRFEEKYIDNPNISIRIINRIFTICINNEYFIRIKKFNKDLSTSNVTTLQTKNFYEQKSTLFGLEDKVIFLYLGYIPSSTWTEISNIHLICRTGNQIHWSQNLMGHSQQINLFDNSILPKVEKESRVKIKRNLEIKKVSNQ